MPNDKQSRAEMVERWPLGGYAPGGYTCNCMKCGQQFIGDKLAYQCLNCAVEWALKTLTAALSRIEALEAENARLREALTPFADIFLPEIVFDDDSVALQYFGKGIGNQLKAGDFRRARSALNPEREEK